MGYQSNRISKVLVGKVITKAILSEDKGGITFELLEGEPVILETHGD